MYPLEHVYSLDAHESWQKQERERVDGRGATGYRDRDIDLKVSRRKASEVSAGRFWEVSSWDELREAVSFLTLMNKREVLYFRGQRTHYDRCVPVLFRNEWHLNGRRFPLRDTNRGEYYALLRDLRAEVLQVAEHVGTPRSYILEHVPAAAASVLQHYELWPTHFIDVTRSLSTALAFAEGDGREDHAYLYVFGMPDLRGSITSDIDQHLTLSRLEAICPPAAKRPHHQDAYLVSRFPEPPGVAKPGDASWDDWQDKTDLMRRLVAKFRLKLQGGQLPGAPRMQLSFLIPSSDQDVFGAKLRAVLLPLVERYAVTLA